MIDSWSCFWNLNWELSWTVFDAGYSSKALWLKVWIFMKLYGKYSFFFTVYLKIVWHKNSYRSFLFLIILICLKKLFQLYILLSTVCSTAYKISLYEKRKRQLQNPTVCLWRVTSLWIIPLSSVISKPEWV